MSEFLINGILQAQYKYDAMGRQAIRTLTSPTAVTIHSVFDSDGRRIAEYNETSGALIREYVWNGWEPVAVIEGGVISFVRADHIGRPVFATNAAGTKVWTATYQPFGGVHTSTGAVPSARFPGQWFQSESGLHQNWMRDYDPTTGRYLQADPLGLVDGASVYGYVKQSPGRWVDPMGKEKRPFILPPDPSSLGPHWVPVPNSNGLNLWNCTCSEETLRFDPLNAGGNPDPHWHFYPNRSNLGKRGQYSPAGGRPELKPGTEIMIENCNKGGSGGGLMFIVPGVMLGIGNDYRDGVSGQGAIVDF
jgi:RHS repeat-associated protein